MPFVVYVLVSAGLKNTYVGQTEDVQNRLALHNSDRVKSTRGRGPWLILHTEPCATRSEAMEREKWFKSRSGRKKIHELILERWPSG